MVLSGCGEAGVGTEDVLLQFGVVRFGEDGKFLEPEEGPASGS